MDSLSKSDEKKILDSIDRAIAPHKMTVEVAIELPSGGCNHAPSSVV